MLRSSARLDAVLVGLTLVLVGVYGGKPYTALGAGGKKPGPSQAERGEAACGVTMLPTRRLRRCRTDSRSAL